jgi:transcriptional regulator with XRE-family HTH domain
MTTTTITTLDPKVLGFWTRCIREACHWSQEALAAASGLDVRTIQRIEAGKRVNITTRRALARGLGYKNPDTFDDPEFITNIREFSDMIVKMSQETRKSELEKQFPEHIRVPCSRVAHGDTLGHLAYSSDGVLLNTDETLSQKVKEVAASLFDYMRDLGDVADVASFSDKVRYNKGLEAMLRELEGLGTAVYSATRSTQIVGSNWVDKTPMPFTVGYVTVVPAETVLQEMLVPRHLP